LLVRNSGKVAVPNIVVRLITTVPETNVVAANGWMHDSDDGVIELQTSGSIGSTDGVGLWTAISGQPIAAGDYFRVPEFGFTNLSQLPVSARITMHSPSSKKKAERIVFIFADEVVRR